MQTVVFDSQSLLKLYLGEPGADGVVRLLREVQEGRLEGRMSIVNLAEVYYILCRRNKEIAEEKEKRLREYGVALVPVDPESSLWKRAATLKAAHGMSLADAFAAATAMELHARLVTGGDAEFEDIPALRVERV